MATTNYPGSLDAYPVPNNGDTISVADHWLGPAVIGIETELGTDPAGTFTDVKSRLDSGLIEEIDQWFMPTTMTSQTGTVTLTNWSRPASGNVWVTPKGTGMSQSSGIFSFPSTGYYEIYIQIYIYFASVAGNVGGYVYTTLNNSSYTNTHTFAPGANLVGNGVRGAFVLRISDITNQKFYIQAVANGTYNISGSSVRDDTSMLIKKIGGL